jgi:putative glutamine amidotransferase
VFIMLSGVDVSSLLITCQNKSAVERHYIPALRLGGWQGEIILATPGASAPSLEGVAGLLMPGGYDIHPCHWDEDEALHHTSELDAPRDALELPLAREAWNRGLPILGICRGEQVLNVALGGSLIQDIASRFGLQDSLHRRGSSEDADEAHPVRVTPGTRLAQLVGGTEVLVNSRHHQAVQRVAPGLKAVAWYRCSPEGPELVEGIEAEAPERWVVGVQWHPENLVRLENGTGRAALGIFQGFVAAMAGR